MVFQFVVSVTITILAFVAFFILRRMEKNR